MFDTSANLPCSCYSGNIYQECCQPYHLGDKVVKEAVLLMRSRYSAYALGLVNYIISTTHPNNSDVRANRQAWKKRILNFSKKTSFEGLEVINSFEEEQEAFVTFTAHLKQNNNNTSFTEKSHFLKVDGLWFYLEGQIVFDNRSCL